MSRCLHPYLQMKDTNLSVVSQPRPETLVGNTKAPVLPFVASPARWAICITHDPYSMTISPSIVPFGVTYEKIGTIQRRLAWPLHKDDTLSRSGRPTGLNIYFFPSLKLKNLAAFRTRFF